MIVRKRELKTVYGSNSQNRARYAVCIIIVFALLGITLDSHTAYPQTMTTASPFVNLPGPNDNPRRREAFARWDKRGNTGEAVAALSIVEEITRDNPKCFECRLRLCRVNYLMAMRKRKERAEVGSIHCPTLGCAGA